MSVQNHIRHQEMARPQETLKKPCFMPPYLEKRIKEALQGEERAGFKRGLSLVKAERKARNADRGDAKVQQLARALPTDREPLLHIYDAMHHGKSVGRLLKIRGGKYRDRSAQNAYLGAIATRELYHTVYRRNSFDNQGSDMISVVHVEKHMANAYWDSNQRKIFFGDGDGLYLNFTFDLDIVGHEWTHAVTEYTCNLDYENQSGALNESLSDMFGSQVKQRAKGQTVDVADWLIGDFVIADIPHGKKQALRSLSHPGEAYDDKELGKDPQPWHMGDYMNLPNTDKGDYGGVHYNSGIPNNWFYRAATSLGGHSWDRVGPVVYDVMQSGDIGHAATFADFANATIASASRLFKEEPRVQDAIVTAWREVGVLK